MDPDRKRRQQEAYDLQMWGATEVCCNLELPELYTCLQALCGGLCTQNHLNIGFYHLLVILTVVASRYGLIFTTTLHHTWPLFRRQTLAGKAFVVSGFTIFGLVTWADHYLIAYEREERQQNEMLRRAAQRSIASTGKVASEREIKSWMMDNKESYLRRMQEGTSPVASKSE